MLQETTTSRMKPAIVLEDISKSFPGVRALSGVSLTLYPGSVTALIGENGAGKSTLVKILTGIYQPDGGVIRVDGDETHSPTALSAAHAGVTAIHQETVLFDELSVAENIFSGSRTAQSFRLDRLEEAERRCARTAAPGRGGNRSDHPAARSRHCQQTYGGDRARFIDRRQRRHHGRADSRAGRTRKFTTLDELIVRPKADGKAILFISHKFDEIFRIADRYTVFRDGGMVGEGLIADVTQDQLVKMMVGRDVGQVFPKVDVAIGEPVLTVSGYRHPTEFEDINFELRRGEILGFYGLIGAGRSEFMQSLIGITRPSAGAVKLDGEVLVIRSPAEAIEAGIVYVPEERGRQGAIIGLPIFQNVTLPSLHRTSRSGFLKARPQGIRAGARIYPAARSARGIAGSGRRHFVRRQPAEGGHRQVAGDAAEGDCS